MRVLMVNHPSCARYQGGDGHHLQMTAFHLRQLGVEVDYTTAPEPQADGYDLAHVFNLRTVPATLEQLQALKARRVPVALTPLHCNMGLVAAGVELVLQQRLTELPKVRTATTRPEHLALMTEALRLVDYLLPNSYVELAQLRRDVPAACDKPFSVTPAATSIDETTHWPTPDLFVQRYGIRDFVLQVSRVEIPKNQLLLALALADTSLPLVLIGALVDENYARRIRAVLPPERLLLMGRLPREEVESAYAAARVHVLPSWVETCGLVSLDAAAAGASVVVSNSGCELEYFRDLARYCDPFDPASIRRAVVAAYTNYAVEEPRRRQLQELLDAEFTWTVAAHKTKAAYERLLTLKTH